MGIITTNHTNRVCIYAEYRVLFFRSGYVLGTNLIVLYFFVYTDQTRTLHGGLVHDFRRYSAHHDVFEPVVYQAKVLIPDKYQSTQIKIIFSRD